MTPPPCNCEVSDLLLLTKEGPGSMARLLLLPAVAGRGTIRLDLLLTEERSPSPSPAIDVPLGLPLALWLWLWLWT